MNARIAIASRRMRTALIGLLVLIPVANLLFWLVVNQFAGLQDKFPTYLVWPLPPTTRLVGFLICLLPTAVALAGLTTLMRLFRLYEGGQIFTADNVACYRRLAKILLWWCGVGILMDPLMSVGLTLHNPPGRHVLSVGLVSADLTALMTGLFLAIISWVMEEAQRLKEDQDLTV